jgi:hypothetical protein
LGVRGGAPQECLVRGGEAFGEAEPGTKFRHVVPGRVPKIARTSGTIARRRRRGARGGSGPSKPVGLPGAPPPPPLRSAPTTAGSVHESGTFSWTSYTRSQSNAQPIETVSPRVGSRRPRRVPRELERLRAARRSRRRRPQSLQRACRYVAKVVSLTLCNHPERRHKEGRCKDRQKTQRACNYLERSPSLHGREHTPPATMTLSRQ